MQRYNLNKSNDTVSFIHKFIETNPNYFDGTRISRTIKHGIISRKLSVIIVSSLFIHKKRVLLAKQISENISKTEFINSSSEGINERPFFPK